MAPTHSASSQNIMILAVAGMDLLFISFYTIPIVYLTKFVVLSCKILNLTDVVYINDLRVPIEKKETVLIRISCEIIPLFDQLVIII